MINILVSIIIPTYNDWERLSFCICALSKQTFPQNMFEVIVINNNVYDTAPSLFNIPNNCKIIAEKVPGSYAARNAGLKIAKGEIIGFTDSDCIPDKDWIKNAVEYLLQNKTCSRIAGKIVVFFKSEKPRRAELYDKIFAFNQEVFVTNSGTSVTANLFTYRHVFEKIGYFKEDLMSGGDFLWGTIATGKGYKVDYVDNVIVDHPARESLKQLVKKEKRVGGSQAIFLKTNSNMLLNFLELIKEFRPRIKSLKLIFMRGKSLSASDKISLFFIRQYLLGIRAYEKFRVQLGEKPNRV